MSDRISRSRGEGGSRTMPVIAVCLALILVPEIAPAQSETRCGWFANPTPGNFSLTDADDVWWLAAQGRGGVPGFDAALDAGGSWGTWIEVNGSYGYGCACLDGVFGRIGTGEVTAISRFRAIPLGRCEADPALPSGPYAK